MIFHLVGLFWVIDCVTVVSIFKTMKIRISKYVVWRITFILMLPNFFLLYVVEFGAGKTQPKKL